MPKTKQKKKVQALAKQLPRRDNDITSLESQLNSEGIRQFLEWCVERQSNAWIAENIKEIYKIDASRSAVWRLRNCKKYKPIITKMLDELRRNILLIPLANKEARLQVLGKIVKEALKWSLRSYSKDGDPIYELKLDAATKALKQIQDEIDGVAPLIDNSKHYHLTKVDLDDKSPVELTDLLMGRYDRNVLGRGKEVPGNT